MTAKFRSLLLLTVLCLLGFSSRPAFAQAGVPLWTNRYVGPGGYGDNAAAVAVGPNGNVFVTGYSYTNTFSTSDYATVGYSSAGAPLWTNRYNGGGEDVAAAVAVDASGNVFVTGQSSGGGSGLDYATLKYSTTGLPLWTNRYDGPLGSRDQASAVAVDQDGNVYVTGNSYGTSSDRDYATLKYSGGGSPLWTNRYNGPGNSGDIALAVVVDPGSNAIVTGFSIGVGTATDFATIKYSSAGAALWVQRYNGTANSSDEAHALAVDGSGNVYVTGSSFGNGGGLDYLTIKYSGTGAGLWTNRYDGPGNGSDAANAIAVDANGNAYVTGYSAGSAGQSEYATIKYSDTGAGLWTNRYHGPGNGSDAANAVTVDANGNAYVSGYSAGSAGYSEYATIAYSSGGTPLWTNRYSGPGNGANAAQSVVSDAAGNVYVTGSSPGGNGDFDYATIKYASFIPTPIPLQLEKAGNAVVLGWADARFSLQSAPLVTGTFTNVPGATSPYTNSISAAQQFFRLQAN